MSDIERRRLERANIREASGDRYGVREGDLVILVEACGWLTYGFVDRILLGGYSIRPGGGTVRTHNNGEGVDGLAKDPKNLTLDPCGAHFTVAYDSIIRVYFCDAEVWRERKLV